MAQGTLYFIMASIELLPSHTHIHTRQQISQIHNEYVTSLKGGGDIKDARKEHFRRGSTGSFIPTMRRGSLKNEGQKEGGGAATNPAQAADTTTSATSTAASTATSTAGTSNDANKLRQETQRREVRRGEEIGLMGGGTQLFSSKLVEASRGNFQNI